jgi:hypothetical protein
MTANHDLPCAGCGQPVRLDVAHPPGSIALHAWCSLMRHQQTITVLRRQAGLARARRVAQHQEPNGRGE